MGRHRDAAAQVISSQVGAVDAGGACRPAGTNPVSLGSGRSEVSWANVADMFTEYRFALVMENTATANYITEKPLNGFLGGTIPVYFGTTDVFKVFNKRAFIYYDIANPQLAIDRIASKRSARFEFLQSNKYCQKTTHEEERVE